MFDQLVDGACAALWNLDPSEAVYLGRHEYDGVVPDLTEEAIESQLDRLAGLRLRLDALEGLGREQELDRLQLAAAIDSAHITWSELRPLSNPMTPIPMLDTTLYLSRDYAPFAHRAEQASAVLEQAPRLLDQARAAISGPVPQVFCEWAVRQAEGMADSLLEDLSERVDAEDDLFAAASLAVTGELAARSLQDYADWIRVELLPGAVGEFAVGGDLIESMVRRVEGLDIGLADLLALGEEDLAANVEAMEEAAAAIDPGKPPAKVYEEHVASVHAPRGGLIRATREMVEGIRSFLVERDLITIPSEVRAIVAETPAHMRWAFAMMSTPGPYETEAAEAYYYVTPDDPAWDDAKAEEWLRALNTFALEDISIHEAYPGHYVHFLHYDHAPTEVSKRVASYAFSEGWAHYVEQMMWEEGYRDGDPRFRMAQLAEALVRNCRFVASIRMHEHGMSLDEATRLFMDTVFYEETPARTEAERGAFDPGYFSYTLGKLEILRCREMARAAAGEGFDLKGFHDATLSRGAPPVGLLERILMGD